MGFSLKKVFKVAKKAVAVTTIGVIAPAKAVTWAGRKTGIRQLKKLDTFVGKEYRQTKRDAIFHAQAGASIGAAIASGNAVQAAVNAAGAATGMVAGPKLEQAMAEDSQPMPSDQDITPGPKLTESAKQDQSIFDWFLETIGLED